MRDASALPIQTEELENEEIVWPSELIASDLDQKPATYPNKPPGIQIFTIRLFSE